MKLRHVFSLVPDCHVAGWRFGDVWRRHFYDGLEQAGIRVVQPRGIDFGWARPPQSVDPARTAGARARTSEALLTQILPASGPAPQAVVSCCFSHDLEMDLVRRVRKAGLPWINFFCDSLYAFDWVAELAANTSLNWFVESEAESRYRALGVPYLRAPYALNPSALPDASCLTPSRALLFVGAANSVRLRTVASLRLAGVDLHVRGWGWNRILAPGPAWPSSVPALIKATGRQVIRRLLHNRLGDHLEHDELINTLRQSMVVLGLNAGGTGPSARSYLKLRDLEFPGMGCCYLGQHHADLGEALIPGVEVVTFRSALEAARLVRDLARHPATCREIGRRARTRVLREHTWAARLPLIESLL